LEARLIRAGVFARTKVTKEDEEERKQRSKIAVKYDDENDDDWD